MEPVSTTGRSTGAKMLAILVPSRGRPQNLRRLISAVDATASDSLVYVRLDNDDKSEYDTTGAIAIKGPRVFFAASINELAAMATKDGATHLAMFGDDVVPETVGWDRMLVDALDGRLGVAYGSDGLEHLHGPDLPTHYVTQTEVYLRLGWLALPGLRHLFLDNVAREIGCGLGNFVYVPEAKITHNHPWAGLADDDQTYREGGRNKRVRQHDKVVFDRWRNGPGYAESLRKLGV